MYRAETNIRHNEHSIIAGETFDPAEYDMTDEQLAHLIEIGAVSDSKAKAAEEAKAGSGVSVDTVAEEESADDQEEQSEDEPAATEEAKAGKGRRGARRSGAGA